MSEMNGLDVRSPLGHAAYSMQGTDERWVLIQVNTFTNWVNDQIRHHDMKVENLQTDLCDGIKLCLTMENLQGKRVGRVIRKPMNQHHYLENVNLALRAMTNDGIKLVNIGSEDIVNGNLRLILGLIWRLILKYQISQSKVPPKKLMLAWLNAVVPECEISNFNTDWNDGIALHALIEYCKPGTSPNWRQLDRRDSVGNCRAGMQLAKDTFNIPMVVSPENLASPDLDELSGMTYLSYFMKVDSPGYHATLRWVQNQIPARHVSNFQTDWNDGVVLGSLVDSLGGHIQGWPDHINRADHEALITKIMSTAEAMGVNKVISAHEMADPEVDHLGVMAYAAWFEKLKRGSGFSSVPVPAPAPVPEVVRPPPSPPPPPRPATPPAQKISLHTENTSAEARQTVYFKLEAQGSNFSQHNVRVEVVGPSSRPPVSLNWQGLTGTGQFTPTEPGHHKIVVYNEGEVVRGAPADIHVTPGIAAVTLATPIRDTAVNTNTSIRINAADARRGAVRVEARSPSGYTQEMAIGENGGVYTANFTPTEVGDWHISILYEGAHIQGSPFNVRVYDAAQVKVFGLEGGAVGKMFSFSVDTAGAGEGQLTVDINHDGRSVPVQVSQEGRGMYRVTFTPNGGGLYTIRVYFAGMEVTGSPYSLEIVDSSMVTASGEGLSSVEVNRKSVFVVNTGHRGGTGGDIRVNIKSPLGHDIPCSVVNNGDGTYTIEYTANDVGEYQIDVYYYGKPINGSPFRVQAYDWNRISIQNLSSSGIVGKMVEFDIDAQYAGSGNLEIMVNDGTIPCSVQNRGNRQFHATFMPKESVPHHIQMRFNGKEVPGSPWRVDMRSAAHVTVSGTGLQLVPVNRLAVFDVRAGTDGNVTAHVTAPSKMMVPCQVMNMHNGTYQVQYTPTEVGYHHVEVQFDGLAVPGSPFTCKTYDVNAITVGQFSPGMVGKHVEFTIDVSAAGEGQLEIMVNRGAVPNTVKQGRSRGVFVVTFVPRDPRTHMVDIKFNGELYPRCPISIPVLDASQVTVQGDGIRQVAANRSSFFRVNTQSAGDADLSVRVTAPSGRNCPAHVTSTPGGGYEVEYKPKEVGSHQVDVEYASTAVPGSPFFVKSYDPSLVMVTGIRDAIVGKRHSFEVDVNSAGEGSVETTIEAGSSNIQTHIKTLSQGKFEISFTPMEGGFHQANVIFNGEHVPGSPFAFNVTDASSVTASGDGLGLVACGKLASFLVNAPGASMADLSVRIYGPNGREVYPRLHDNKNGNFLVDWTPQMPGDHRIEVEYNNIAISGSPFIAKAWDASAVIVSNLRPGVIHKPLYFNVDASRAGAGNLELIVSVAGENVPNFVNAEGNARFEVSFTPHTSETHAISVKFNGEAIPGSPFFASLIDGGRASAAGEGLERAAANRPAMFTVDTHGVGDARLDVTVTSSRGANVPARVSGTPERGFHVEYTPTHVGVHSVVVEYADVAISGSPFHVPVFDAGSVRVSQIPDGVLHKLTTFEVDASQAGEGTLSVDIQSSTTKPYPQVTPKGGGRYSVSFTPVDASIHHISIEFNGERVPGSPFMAAIFDTSSILVDWAALRHLATRSLAKFMINTSSVPEAGVDVDVIDPFNHKLASRVVKMGKSYQAEFTPVDVGPHTVSVGYGGQEVAGSPFTSFVYDAEKVRITDVTEMGGLAQERGFTVDTGAAGEGDVEVSVTCGGRSVPVRRRQVDAHTQRYTFVPTELRDHVVEVAFNDEPVAGSPLLVAVSDPAGMFSVDSSSLHQVALVDQLSHMIIGTRSRVDAAQMAVTVQAPNRELVPAKMVQQPDGDFKVEYSSMYTGRHTVEIMYAGQAIMGSPFYVEIYDPNKIRVEGSREGSVGQIMDFEIIRHEAGKAELGLQIMSPSGVPVHYSILPTKLGDRVTYTPTEPGPHLIYITYGGLEVPGCPVTQTIKDTSSAMAFGDGLYKGLEDVPAQFTVDAKGYRGDLQVEVEGPNSMAKCRKEPNQHGQYIITYTPVEVGVYTVHIRWNGRDIDGSPFHPKVVDPRKLRVSGGWESLVDASNRMSLMVGETKRIEFDTSQAGPGVVTAEVRGPDGLINSHVEHLGAGAQILTFVPRVEGEHYINLYWSEALIPRSPIIGVARGGGGGATSTLLKAGAATHEKVVLTGRGLKEAGVRQEAEFVIDGTEAGPGSPEVTLTGVKEDIDVRITPLGGAKYRATYIPQLHGAYLLNIMWADRQVRGSPFKVNVIAHSDATKVVCSGEGLKVGILGREIKSIIDTRRAGPGELTAHCMGPNKVAFCELFDHRDGTFGLSVRPQEPGRHVLQVKYGGEHVPGSPFVLRVSGAPDASKVRVSGPGIEHGILAMYQSRFICETRGAGAGQLTVRIRGPKGAFRVEMQRESQKDRTILCRYDPTEVGDYIISVKWSGEDVPGSPFHIQIFDTQSELERFLHENPSRRTNQPYFPPRSDHGSEWED